MSVTTDRQADSHSIHHVNFPISDRARTAEWYGKVFGMTEFIPGRRSQGATVPATMALLMTHGNFDLHFSPTDQQIDAPVHYHFAIEVEDFDAFLKHLDQLGVPYAQPEERPQNNSKWSVLRDPDGHHVEITWHGDRDW